MNTKIVLLGLVAGPHSAQRWGSVRPGPAAMPNDLVTKLNAEVVRSLKDKDVAQRLAREGAEPAPTTPDEVAKFMRAEYEQWKKTIASAKIKID